VIGSANAIIVPLHYEGWAHFSEGAEDIALAFADAGMTHRLCWLNAGKPVSIELGRPSLRPAV
jgi:hypothetical protein